MRRGGCADESECEVLVYEFAEGLELGLGK
jgi:hypothetical protein